MDETIVEARDIQKTKNMSKDNIPHQAEILFYAEIMQRLPDGRTSGRNLETVSHVFTLFGDSLDDCTNQVRAFLKAIRAIPEETIKQIAIEEVKNEQANSG